MQRLAVIKFLQIQKKGGMSMVYKIPVTWECCGVVEVDAPTVEEAIQKVIHDHDDIPLPEGHYVDGSFSPSTTDIEELKAMVALLNKEK
jgi:hypothetical protein